MHVMIETRNDMDSMISKEDKNGSDRHHLGWICDDVPTWKGKLKRFEMGEKVTALVQFCLITLRN